VPYLLLCGPSMVVVLRTARLATFVNDVCAVRIAQYCMSLGVTLVVLTRAARKRAHSKGCGPLTGKVGHPWNRI
jgi:hypothetical protein